MRCVQRGSWRTSSGGADVRRHLLALLGIPGLLAPAGLVAAPTALLLGGLSLLHAAPAAAQAQLPERFRLTSLALSVGGSPVTLTPSFTPATNLLYRATVDYDATSISVTASWSGSKAVLASSKDWHDLTAPVFSEEAFASSGSSVSLNLKAGGVTRINLSVDTTTTYAIDIHRRPSTDATLSGLTASSSTSASGAGTPLTLDQSFAAGTTDYTASVANERTHVKLTPTVADSNATVKVGKGTSLTAVTSGSASGAISLQVGANVITVKVTAQDGTTTKTYTVTVTRAEATTTTETPINTNTNTNTNTKLEECIQGLPSSGLFDRVSGCINETEPDTNTNTPTDTTTGDGGTPRDLRPSFGRARVPAQSYTEGTEIPPLELPEATGGNGRLFYALSPVLPEGLTLNRRVRRLSGTPTTPHAAREYTWTATDGDGDAARITFTIMVAPDLRPSFDNVSVPDQSYTEGTEITPFVLPEATGGDGPLTYALSPVLPEGLTLNDVTRRLSGTPTTPHAARQYTWTATDGDGDTARITFTVTVAPDRPSFDNVSVPDQFYTEGTAITSLALPEATGGNGPLTYALSPALPNGLTLNDVTRRLSGNPISPQAATRYTWTATDADGDEAELTFTIAIAVDPHRERIRELARRVLAEMARRAMSGALDTIGARFGAVGGSGLSLAGQPVSLESVASVADGVGMAVWNNQSLALGELLGESAFSLRLAATGNEDSDGDVNLEEEGPLWSVWGRGDLASFAGGREEETHYDGWLRSGWLGIDARAGRWVGGMALSHEQGQADYGATMAAAADDRPLQGRLETSLTALYPYGRWTLANGLELQGVVGVGWGEARHTPADDPRETGTLSMRMASLGVRKSLPDVAGLAMALRADAAVTRIETGNGPDAIHNLSADSWRLRTGLEASRRFSLEGEAFLEPFLEAAARQDGGDGLEGSGVELAGGLRYSAPSVAVELRGRWLAAHSEEGAEEQGISLTARYGPGADGQGLFFALSPRWGAATGGAQALWGEDLPVLSTADAGNSGAVDAQVGYGFALPQGGVLTPFAEVGLAGADSRRLRLGTRYAAAVTGLDMAVELAGERRESGDAAAEHALQLDVDLRF